MKLDGVVMSDAPAPGRAQIKVTEWRTTGGAAPIFVLVPPICGLYPPLNVTFAYMARSLAEAGYHTMILEFGGQPGVPGRYSVVASCAAASSFVSTLSGPVLFFGICSGALTSLAASARTREPVGAFCWDLAV